SIKDWGKDKAYDVVGEKVMKDLAGEGAEVGAKLLGGNVQASMESLESIHELGAEPVESENAVDGGGGNIEEDPVPPPATTIDGQAIDDAGNPIQDGQVQLCPPLSGDSASTSLSQSPTYSD